jgi:small nuclear ribonucleoprotein (snRNP)-like protein
MFKTFLYAKIYQLTDFFETITSKPAISRSFKNTLIIILLFSCTKTGGADGVDQSAKLVLEEAEEIVQFAEDNIAFDAQMISLKAALHSGNTEKIMTVISEAKQSAAEMLEDKEYYKAFCQYLLQEKGLLRKGD